jgi:hypothetical protein
MIKPGTKLYHSSYGQLWDKFIHSHELRFCFENSQPVGACDGNLSSFLCFDIHIASRWGHCYPVTQAEAREIMNGARIELIQALSC